MKIGILYICTGNYSVFWEDFYKTFSQNFCKSSELHFFVFTDKQIDFSGQKNIHFTQIENKPWPLITLFRFHTFLSIENELQKCDYLFFFNSNMKCICNITEEEFLPKENEHLVFVRHPGYIYKKKIFIPYDRCKKSTAFIPYRCGGIYVIGAVEGGETSAFLEMCRVLKQNIETDLKQNYIARWHDESQINHYIYTIKNYKLLDPGFCYPVGFDLPFEKKIVGVSKQDKFDVQSFKFVIPKLSIGQKLYKRLDLQILPYLRFIISVLRREKIK